MPCLNTLRTTRVAFLILFGFFTLITVGSANAVTEVEGVTAGQFQATPSGSASYNVPIAVPPGIAGMQPDLSFSYNSQGGNGHMGVGWSLSGLSVIHRCPQTMHQDGAVKPISFDTDARFCLDGQRLVPEDNDYSNYGTDGKTYRTEIESYSRITSYGNYFDGPAYFKVETKSGQTMYFGGGKGPDSFIEAEGRVATCPAGYACRLLNAGPAMVWALGRVEDASDNAMDVHYTHNAGTGEYYPHRIDYAFVGSTAHASVELTYESNRTDKTLGYLAGSKVTTAERLKSVTTKTTKDAVTQVARHYILNYSDSVASGRSTLDSITECHTDANDRKCFKPLTFKWQGEAVSAPVASADSTPFGLPEDLRGAEILPFDHNGDGRTDFLARRQAQQEWEAETRTRIVLVGQDQTPVEETYTACVATTSHAGYTKLYTANADGSFTLNSSPSLHAGGTNNTGCSTGGGADHTKLYSVDYNSDGKSDLVYLSSSNESVITGYTTQQTSEQTNTIPVFGRKHNASVVLVVASDTGLSNGQAVSSYTYTENAFEETHFNMYPVNFDGDTRGDLLIRAHGHAWVSTRTDATLSSGDPIFSTQEVTSSWGMNSYQWRNDKHVIQTLEHNGDGLTDLLLQGIENEASYLLTATGSGYSVVDVTTTAGMTSSKWNAEYRNLIIMDFNGDGLQDVLLQRRNVCVEPNGTSIEYVYDPVTGQMVNALCLQGQQLGSSLLLLSTGDGFHQQPIASFSTLEQWSAKKQELIPVDYDGDGKVDILLRGVGSADTTKLMHNTGSDFVESGLVFDTVHWSKANTKLTILDVGSDDDLDFLFVGKDSSKTTYTAETNKLKADVITEITDSLGLKTTITYKPLTAPGVYEQHAGVPDLADAINIQMPMQVVTNVVVPNGLVDGVGETSYSYAGLKVSTAGRGMLGFYKVVSKNHTNNIVNEAKYHQTFPQVGALKSSKSYWRPSSTINRLVAETMASSTVTQQGKRWEIEPASATETRYDPEKTTSLVVDTQTTTYEDYDDFGNAKKVTVAKSNGSQSDTTGSITSVTTETTSTFDNDTNNWHLGRLRASTVTHVASGAYFVAGNTVTRSSSFEYYPNGLLWKEIVEPNASATESTLTEYQYDTYGNITRKTVTGASTTGSATTRYTQTDYGDSYQYRFATKITNIFGHEETHEFDARFGVMTKLTGPNLLDTEWIYDEFGRKEKEIRADGTETVIERKQCNIQACDADAPAGTALTTITTDSEGGKSKQYADILGRKLRTASTGFSGQMVYVDTVYDARGRVEKISSPYFVANGGTPHWTTYEFDQIDRPKMEILPTEGSAVRKTHRNYSNGATVVEWNELNKTVTRTSNVLGKLSRVIEDSNGAELTHKYDAIGNLRETVANGSSITMLYDNLGRKTAMSDPDMGNWAYEYNSFGELEKQTDAKGQVVTMKYDALGRMIERVDVAENNTTTWVYDVGNKAKGKLTSVTSTALGYTRSHTYDDKGRAKATTTTTNTAAGNAAQSRTSSVEYYANSSRVKDQHFEGNHGLKLANIYDGQGQLAAVYRHADTPNPALDSNGLRQLAQQNEDLAHDKVHGANGANAKDGQANVHFTSEATLIGEAQQLENVDIPREDEDAAIYDGYAVPYVNAANAIFAQHGKMVPIDVDGITIFLRLFDDPVQQGNYEAQLALAKPYQVIANQHRINAAGFLATALSKRNTAAQHRIDALALIVAADTQRREARELEVAAAALRLSADQVDNGKPPLGDRYWYAAAANAHGQGLTFELGNKLSTEHTYDEARNFLTAIRTGAGPTNDGAVQDLEYNYDAVGNLTQRMDNRQNLKEQFCYDGVNRLVRSSLGPMSTPDFDDTTCNDTNAHNYKYNTYGNLENYNGAIQSYGAGTAGPHALTNSGGITYVYDANGNQQSSTDGRAIAWNSFNKPTSISKGSTSLNFDYGSERQRVRQVRVTDTQNPSTTTSTILYWGGGYQEHHLPGGKVEHRYQLDLPGAGILTTRIVQPGQLDGQAVSYLHKDHLGSVDVVTGQSGTGDGAVYVLLSNERHSFDAFGKRRNANWTAGAGTPSTRTSSGYTGHEQLDSLGLVHMNGRIYDPNIGRFLSADPNIQAPASVQNLNRYSYVNNNPLSYTDPSGYFFKKLFKKAYKFASKLSGTYYLHKHIFSKHVGLANFVQVALNFIPVFGQLASAHFAFDRAYFATGSLTAGFKAGFFTYASAAVAGGIGDAGISNTFATSLLHGFSQGVLGAAQGGDFRSAFIGAFAGHYLGSKAPGKMKGNTSGAKIARTVRAAVIGGVSSKLGGGKFQNGAVTAAFVHLYNAEEHPGARRKLSAKGVSALKKAEGLSLQPYDDQTGKVISSWTKGATIGYGHLISKSEWSVYSGGITSAQADALFNADIAPFVAAVNNSLGVYVSQQQFDASVMLAYNIGVSGFSSSSAVMLMNNPGVNTPYSNLEGAWKAWNKSQGLVNQGLINRRNAEWSIYSNGAY